MKNFMYLTLSVILIYFSAFKQIKAQYQQNIRHRSNYNFNTTTSPSTVVGGNDEILNRVYNQILSSTNNDERQHQKLENLENILQRFETRNRDQLDAIRNEIKELGRRMQNLDWLISRNDGNLNQLRDDFDALRHSLPTDTKSNVGKRDQQQSVMMSPSNDGECSDKLDSLATLLTSARSAVHRLEKQTNIINNNVTSLIDAAREISRRQYAQPTKQYLHSALNSLRSQSLYGLTQNPAGRFPLNGNSFPASCAHAAGTDNGIQKVQVGSSKESFYVMCDNDIEGGGWTVIQNREDGSINFNRNWLEYKNGFGNLAGEFFIGLDKLHDLTSAMLHELLIVLEDFEGTRRIARYKQFAIGDDKEDYALRLLGAYEGDAGDSLGYSASYKFSTFDNDNDGWVEGNCALAHTGAWWYNACEMSNLNGQYLGGEISDANQFQGIYWNDFRGPKYSLKSTKMLIRPIDRIFLPDLN